jgi:hypothetical protein
MGGIGWLESLTTEAARVVIVPMVVDGSGGGRCVWMASPIYHDPHQNEESPCSIGVVAQYKEGSHT